MAIPWWELLGAGVDEMMMMVIVEVLLQYTEEEVVDCCAGGFHAVKMVYLTFKQVTFT